MKQIKRRLYGIYFIIVATFIFLLYFLLSNVVENFMVDQQRNRLDEEIISLTEYIENHPLEGRESVTDESDVLSILEELSPILNDRITFLNEQGEVLFDSNVELSENENFFNYSEIQQVLDGEILGVANRTSQNSEYSIYSVAKAVDNDSNQPIGIIRLSSEITDLTEIINLSLLIQFVGTVILALVLVWLTRNWVNRITHSLSEMQVVMGRLTNFDYDARYTGNSYEEIDELGSSLNELAENLEQQQFTLQTSDQRIYSLINQLIIGVMLLDEERRIQIVNPVMNELLGVNLYGKISHLYTDYVKSAELIELIEEAYQKNETLNSEVYSYFPDEKILDANIVPAPGRDVGEQNYIVLLYDITEIRRLESIRTDFAANVSHELRTPITALKGFSETLLDGAMEDKEVLTEFLEIMHKESTRLDLMVQDILQLSKLEQKYAPASVDRIRIREVVEEVFQILQQKIELKEMDCSIEESEPVYIETNRDQLKQLLMNLIANAISYTPANGKVIVAIEQENNQAIVQVIDNGIGIPEADQLRIFERFYRVDKARSRNSGGTGLGLSIVKWIIEGMGGQIELFSEVNVGTTFYVTIPFKKKQ